MLLLRTPVELRGERLTTVGDFAVSAGQRLFFKWIKQHLRIKAFFGTNENAVKTQIWIAISVYVLVAIVKKRLGVAASLYTILQILSLTLFEKTPLDQLLNDAALQNLDSVDSNQLNFFS
jgi:hypothetical protein